MEEFNEIKSMWNQQLEANPNRNSNDIIDESNQKAKKLKNNYYWTIGILSILVIILSYFYYSIFNSQISKQIKGLEIMIMVIIVRVILESISIFKFRKIDFTTDFTSYTKQLVLFYKFRRSIHFILTPIIYILYVYGFISLLTLFKENTSNGFYLYIQFSGFGFLFFFSFILYKIVKRDLTDLKYLKNI
nr:hypothetical protein [uncultured Flavobacterium sp.]